VRIEGKAVTIVGVVHIEITSHAERPVADLTMAIAGMPKIPNDERASELGPYYWMLDVTIPICV
jgi:hypothetical protein